MELTKNDIVLTDMEYVGYKVVSFYVELWFDYGKYLGVKLEDTDYIDFYLQYNYETKELSETLFVLNTDKRCEDLDHEFTDNELAMLRELCEEEYQRERDESVESETV